MCTRDGAARDVREIEGQIEPREAESILAPIAPAPPRLEGHTVRRGATRRPAAEAAGPLEAGKLRLVCRLDRLGLDHHVGRGQPLVLGRLEGGRLDGAAVAVRLVPVDVAVRLL